MKQLFSTRNYIWAICALLVLAAASCKKDSDGSPDNSPGNLQSSGINPGEAPGGQVVVLKGSGLGDIRSIVFDKNNVPATFTPTLNTSTAVVFRVPDTAFGGDQNIIFTNSAGKTLSVPFKVIALPGVSSAFPTDFEAGTVVTLTGNNLDDVTKVVIEGTTSQATIVSKSRKQLVIQMPATTVNRAKLRITNSSGERLTDQEFVYVTNAFGIFKDAFGAGIDNWSWGGTYEAVTDDKITGTSALRAAYDPGGSWAGLSMHSNAGFSVAGYSFISFWAKGADVDKQVDLKINWGPTKTYTIPAGKWTYFREPIAGFIAANLTINDFVFQIHESGKTLYFDNILLVK
jgi:hypothetical protein